MDWPTTRAARVAVPIVVVAVLVGTFVVGREIALRRAGEVELISVSRTGEYVTEDEALVDDLTGRLPVSDELVLAAYCQNGVDWLRDFALGLEIVVSTDPRLVRAVELAASGEYDLEMVAAIEQWIIAGELSEIELRSRASDAWGERAIDYLAARSEPPSNAAVGRFVVYATSTTMSHQVVVFADTERLRPDEMRGFAARSGLGVGVADVLVAGEPGTRRLDGRRCPSLVRDS